MKFTRVVLKPETTWANVKAIWNSSKAWTKAGIVPMWSDELYIERWKIADGDCIIAYVQDPVREIRFFHLNGANSETHLAAIRSGIATYERGEIEAMLAAAGTPAEKVVAVYHAAASASSEPDPTLRDFLIRSLADSELAVRKAAVDASLVALWPDLQEPLERVATKDSAVYIRTFAKGTLEQLRQEVWSAASGAFDFAPLPPNKRITPLTTVGEEWYKAARPNGPGRNPAAAVPSQKPAFHLPEWLVESMREGDESGIQWHTTEQIGAAAGQFVEFSKPAMMSLSEDNLAEVRALWKSMVPVADGPEFTDRTGRTDRSRLFVNRDDAKSLLLALAPDHPPSLWVPAGRTRAEVEAAAASYFFSGIPPLTDLPRQGRLFLTTQTMIGGGFEDLERGVTSNPFTDMLPWGSAHADDPYPERVTLGRIPVGDLRRFMAQDPNGLPRTSLRTRYSRSVIQLIDWRDGYFADLFFRPTSPPGWAEAHNDRFDTDFPPGTPIDVVGALSGLVNYGPEKIQMQADEATDPDQRRGMLEIVGFLEQGAPGSVNG